ncbi:MAG: 4Fe-4S binding protein [Eubacteriales bacterium]|nr:4Fe-4S binding protein [Eubacteriales bacterium]
MELKVIKERCPQNHRCPAVAVCHVHALSQKSMEAPAVDEDQCTACGKCVRLCPTGALVLKQAL